MRLLTLYYHSSYPVNLPGRKIPLFAYAYSAANTLVDSYAYTFDAASQRTTETTPNWVRKFEYDQQRQLTAAYRVVTGGTAKDANYNYGHQFDAIGNRLNATANGFVTTYVPNNLNQYTSIALQGQATTQPTYDDNGNMLSDGNQAYTFDDENRLTKVERNGSASVSVYDALCRRVAYKKQTGDTVTAETRYVYDGWNVVAELNSSNNVKRRYTWGLDLSGTSQQDAGGVGGLLAMNVPSSYTTAGNYIYNYDGNGNITSMVRAADQNVVAKYEYGPFGETLTASGPMATANPYRFSTKPTDDETGLVYYGYRYYNPAMGRWVNRDFLEENGGKNVYAILGNDVVNTIDLLGLAGATTHGLRRCEESDCCPVLVQKAMLIMASIKARIQEMNAAQVNGQEYWLRYGHQVQLLQQMAMGNRCVELILQKCPGWPTPMIPDPSEIPAWVPPNPWKPVPPVRTTSSFVQRVSVYTGLTGGALFGYLIISEGSHFVFPPRNLIPVL